MPISKHEARQWARKQTSYVVCVDDLAKAYEAGYALCEERLSRKIRTKKFPTDSELLELRKVYPTGDFSAKDLAERFGVTPRQIYYTVQKHNITKTFAWSPRAIKFLLTHYNKDMTAEDIARHFKINSVHAVESAYFKHRPK